MTSTLTSSSSTEMPNLDTSHQKVKVAVTDIDGILRGKIMSRKKFDSASAKGFGFCNVIFGWDSQDLCYDNVDYTGWHSGYPDALVHLDASTHRHIPWENELPFFLGDFISEDGAPLSICPRQLVKRIISQHRELGYEPMAAMEFEWFNFRETPQSIVEKGYHQLEPVTPGMFGYSLLRAGMNADFFTALVDELAAFGVPLEGLHTETGPGVLEAAIEVSDALEAADRAVLFKSSVKQIAHRFGILPTFMARWSSEYPGCSGHLHQSLWDLDKKQNLFFAEGDRQHQLPKLFQHYLAGQIHCMPEILPLYAPTINSYKRLVEGYWAPTSATWGYENRTVALRVIPGGSSSQRLETRVCGSDANPYLSMAAALASGLYGIRHKLELNQKPVTGNGYKDTVAQKLPSTLLTATERFDQSEIAKELFGEEFVKHFAATRLWEVKRYDQAVTTWELERYFEII